MPRVDIWTISLADPPHGHDITCLSSEEIARAARFRFDPDRIRWIRARAALRTILGDLLHLPPGNLRFVIGPHGKPALDLHTAPRFNLSHAGDYALLAVTEDVPVGADIERIRERIDIAAMLRRLGETDLPGTIPELYQRWTQREARSKTAGGKLFDPPDPHIFALSIPAPDGYAAAVASPGAIPVLRPRE